MLYQSNNPHGGDIYGCELIADFSANTNPYGTPQGIIDAICASLGASAAYPDPYCRRLISAISDHERIPADHILCGSGAAELIYSFCLAVRPRSAVETAPAFSEYALGLEQTGCIPERYLLREEADFDLDEGILTVLMERRPEVLFLCTPNNPTGRLIPRSLMEQILAVSRQTGTRVFLDECFLDLSDDPAGMKDMLDSCPNLLILKAFTKSYGMAGIRLGYCMSGDASLLRAMSKTVQPWNVSTPAQAAGIAALKETEFLGRTRQLIPVQRAFLSDGLRKLGFRVIPGAANYILFHGPEDLRERLLEKKISIRSCANYHGLSSGWFRIAVRLPEENRLLLNTIAQVCGKDATWQETS